MAKDRKKVQHIHSSVPDKQPTPAALEVGEIAVNNAKGQEFLSIKNSEDKVVRFSSDEQIVTIMEKKEVIPYVGYVRGETGPSATSADTPTADARGSYGITNNDLLNNKSNIVVKFNQVAAGNTAKHKKVNGAKDAYNKLVNPTTDGGVTDGAGFFIDMSRYAMQDANPSFSSTTNTCRTTMSGTTIIRGLDGACGSLFDIKVNSANTDIETATTEVTVANTTIGTNSTTISGNTTLNVSGATTETNNGAVTITNNNDKTETTKGNVVDNVSGTTTENLSGKLTVNVTGGTEFTSCSAFTVNTNDYKIKQCDGTNGSAEFDFCGGYKINTDNMVISACTTGGTMTVKENAVNVSGGTLTIRESGETDFSGATLTEKVAGNSTTTIGGNSTTIVGDTTSISTKNETNISTTSGNTNITSTGNTCINATVTAAIVGATKTNVGKNCSDAGQTTTLNLNGTTINETGTTVNISGSSNVNVSADTICLSGKTAANMYAPTTNIGTSCGGSSASTVNISGTTINEGGTTINENATNYNGAITNYNLSTTNYTLTGNTINEYGNAVNISGNTTNITGDTNLNMTSADVCIYGTNEAFLGAATVNVGTNCDSTTVSNNINIKSNNNINVTSVNENHTATTINSTSTNYNVTANTETHTTTSFSLNTTDVCLNASSAATVGGDISTNIGANCAGTPISNTTNIYGDTINNSGATINSSATTINNNATTINNSATTYNVTATSYFTGDVHIDSRSKLYLTPDCTSDLTSTTVNAALCEVFTRGEVTMTKDANPSDIRLSAIYRLYQNGEQIGDDINVPKDGFLKDVELVNVNNIYYLRFTWNIYDSDTGTYRTGTTDVNVEDLVKDIDENNTNTGRGVNVDVWYNETAKKMNVSATTTVVINNADGTGTKTFSKSNAVNSLTSYTLNSTSGDVKSTATNTNWTYDPFAEKKNIVVPTDASHINRKTVSWSYGSVTGATGGSYDPGDGTVNTTNSSRTMSFVIPQYLKDLNNNLSSLKFNTGTTNVSDSPYNGSVEKTITIPSSIDHLDEWNGECFTIPHNLCVDGTITAGGSIYSTSDERKKQDIQHIALDDKLKVRNIPLKSFAFKDDPQRKVYGVIAQEVEAAGLKELVHTDEEGMLSVDYTSFLILRIAYLEKLLGQMHAKMAQFEEKINKK